MARTCSYKINNEPLLNLKRAESCCSREKVCTFVYAKEGTILKSHPKGVGPSTTLAWPGWKQSDIPVEMDTARLETSHTDTVKELQGYSQGGRARHDFSLAWIEAA